MTDFVMSVYWHKIMEYGDKGSWKREDEKSKKRILTINILLGNCETR